MPGIEQQEVAEVWRQKEDAAARSHGLEIERMIVRGSNDLTQAFATLAQRGVHAVVVPNTSLLNPLAGAITDVAIKHQLPTIGSPTFARNGGLLGYGAVGIEMCRRAAEYVDKILKGAQPADLSMEGPPKFELIVNLRTARALGLAMPAKLLAAADQRVE